MAIELDIADAMLCWSTVWETAMFLELYVY